jgi:hypothetical protein
MTSTRRAAQGHCLRLPVRAPIRLAALALCAAACGQRSDQLPPPPLDYFHYPAQLAAVGQGLAAPVLLVESTNLDGTYSDGTLLAASTDPSLPLLGGVTVSSYATDLRVIQDAPAVLQGSEVPGATACGFTGPLAFLGTRDHLYRMALSSDGVPSCGDGCVNWLEPRFSSDAWALAVSCPAGRTRRVWVGFLEGKSNAAYVGQLTLDDTVQNPDGTSAHHDLDDLVEVYVGNGAPQAFAWDATWDRLYFVTREYALGSYLRWIDPGVYGCQPFLDNYGLQDVTQHGCHVESGIDLSRWLRGAEGADIRLSKELTACDTPADPGVQCRRAYLGIRVYDADLAGAVGNRPIDDIGGQLWVLEIPQTAAGAAPRLLHTFDVGNGVERVQVLSRTGHRDLVAVVSRVDGQLWIYDDESGALAGGVGRDQYGVPVLGHDLVGLAATKKDDATARLYIAAESDHWISAVEVSLDPVANPVPVCVVLADGTCLAPDAIPLGKKVLHIEGNLP